MTARLSNPVTTRMHLEFTRLRLDQSVGEALQSLRRGPSPGRIVYFYVVDDDGRLQGVVPTRRLILSPAQTPLAEILVPGVVAVPATATIHEACGFFLQYRLLAFPVVDENNRIQGVIDVDLYAEPIRLLERATPVSRIVAPLTRFMHIEASGGFVLLAFTLAALVLANSSLAAGYHAFWETHLGIHLGTFSLEMSLLHWVNDGLMTLFFFVVGLEIKRELVAGELADPRKALLPIVAALGGMLAPALVYLLAMAGRDGWRGWAVPTATDIAFVVGVLTLIGPRVPIGLKILLLTLAIADDIGAVIVIAVVFTTDIALSALAVAGAGLGLVLVLRWLGARSIPIYALVGACVWLAFLRSGIHPTVAGVLLGLLTPARPLFTRHVFLDVVSDIYARMGGEVEGSPDLVSPLERLEAALHPWVAFAIMPLFALANAGVTVEWSAVATPVAVCVAVALLVGKPAGIVLFSWASIRLGLTRLPAGVNWPVLLGAGCLGGIGFTMSLFIAGLAFSGSDAASMNDQAKIGILSGSTVSGVLGCLLLLVFLPRRPTREEI